MAILTTTAFTSALKILYPAGLEEVWYKKAPILAWMPKTYNFEGASKQINPIISGINGSTTFADALSAKSNPTLPVFNVTRVKDYVIGSVDNEALEASKSQKGAVAQALKTQMDAAMYEFGRSAAFQAWGDGTGTRVTVSSESGGTVTVTQRRDLVRLELGMLLERKNSSGTLQTGHYAVDAIDLNAGTFDYTALNGAGTPASTDTLARKGDYTATAANVLDGILSWIPATAPTSGDSHFGVDRSQFVERLAGGRIGGAGKTIEEAVFDAQAEASMMGGEIDTLWMNSARYAELLKSIQGKAWYNQDARVTVSSSKGKSGKVRVGFPGFVFPGEQGPVTVMSDPNCPYAYGLATKRDSWELACLRGCPHFSEEDGRKFLREGSADAIEFRLKVYWQLCCKRPVDSVLIDWDN